jgi:hypothetical protein
VRIDRSLPSMMPWVPMPARLKLNCMRGANIIPLGRPLLLPFTL